jgi:broad specificity phosphatase PhoE
MSIYFVRHPETTWNTEGKLQGTKEGLITKKGKFGSIWFVNKSIIYTIKIIYTANNNRTRYLANLITKKHTNSKVIIDNRLNERSFGSLEGLSSKDVGLKNNFDPNNYKQRYNWRPPEGESLHDIKGRVESFLKDLSTKQSKVNGDIFVVTSGGIIKTTLLITRQWSLEVSMLSKINNLQLYKLENV